MRYTICESIIKVVGTLWMPSATAAQRIKVDDFDVQEYIAEDGTIARDNVERYLNLHAGGNFQNIIDFSASLEYGDETFDFDWENEDNEGTYNSCMCGDYE